MDFIKMMRERNNFRVIQEIMSHFEEIKTGIKKEFLSELRKKLKIN